MKAKLKVNELYILESELLGVMDEKTKEVLYKGLVSQKLNGTDKYHLLDFVESVVSPNKTNVNKLRDEGIKKFGVDEGNGKITIPFKVDSDELDTEGNKVEVINPKLIEFNNEQQEILEAVKEFDIHEFKVSILNFEADEVYPVFSKLLKQINKSDISEIN